MALQLNFAARSDVGRVRSKNDDSAYVGRYLAVVADGMGGHVGGDVASASVVLDLAPLDRNDHPDPGTMLADEIQSANLILNDLVHDNPKLAGMGTTCTAVLVDNNVLHMAHIGDSRAYRIKNNVFEQLSADHTFVQRLIDEGRLNPEDAESHPHKNVLMRVLGDVDASPELDVTSFETQPGERWMLCSDGLNAVVDDATIERLLRADKALDEICRDLVDETLARGAPDNVTIVVFETAEAEVTVDDNPKNDELTESALQVSNATNGETVSAALLRADLGSRPHLLVGAAELATDTDQIPIVTRSSSQKRAAALLHGASEATAAPQAQGAAELDEDAVPSERRSWPLLTMFGVFLILFATSLAVGFLWIRGQYYVGTTDDHVAIFQGVPQSIGPLELSSVEESTEIPLSRLPGYSRQRIEAGLPAQDLNHAREILVDLEAALIPEAPPVSPSDPPDDSIPLAANGVTASASIAGATAGATGGNP
ncbi:PP2C family protein-serine/threonine phosphatase [Enteractinococcus helveticum]|uniref:Serine/threonine protein phosphatase n=1 Tax=Enteractinococcus helveticum TaxID=1837282 RepID=A0A1B7LYZ3_9MICC|nr:PP2C family serine/threonine-protein phosphatase [Enteractinococcus helveticum]OAV60557.1 serine/threonine protein phosphatase [Enteractinococcus helveticum]